MEEGWAIVLGASLAIVSGLILFCIQQIVSRYQKKESVRASLKFEMDANWELMKTHQNISFIPLDTILQSILLSGDVSYFSKELQENYILMYYRELSYYKKFWGENAPPGSELEKNNAMFYRTMVNLKDKLRPKKELRQQKKANRKASKHTSI